MKLLKAIALLLVLGAVRPGILDSIKSMFGGKSDKEEKAEDEGSEEKAKVDDYERPKRAVEAPHFADEVNWNPFADAYDETEQSPEVANANPVHHGEPASLVPDTEDGEGVNLRFFDFDDYFQKMKNIDCSRLSDDMDHHFISPQSPDDITNLCEQSIENKLLAPMSRADQHAVNLYNYLKKYIYLPLGIDIQPKFTFPDVLTDTFFMGEDHSMIHKDTPIPSNHEFLADISGIFKDMEKSSMNFDANREHLSSQIIDILKRFHVFWNVHRARNQMSSVEENTLEIIHSLLKSYKTTTQTMRQATMHVLQAVKEGYFKFLRAYRMQQVLSKKPIELVALQITRRYKENVERIRMHKHSNEQLTAEIAYLADLARAFVVLNYKLGVEEEENVRRFEAGITNKIAFIYDTYRKYFVENGESCYDEVRGFTATLLLKFKHRLYIMFKLYTMEAYLQLPASELETQDTNAIKIYYQMFDNFLLVPAKCLDLVQANLDSCASQQAFGIVQNFYSQFQLFTSVSGNNLLSFVRSSLKKLFESLNQHNAFDSFSAFKEQYLTELSHFAKLYRQKYRIHDMEAVDQLENDLGFEIEKAKNLHEVSDTNFEAIDELDKAIYEYFLSVKTRYNQVAPVNKDPKLMKQILKDFGSLLDSFSYDSVDSNVMYMMNLMQNLKNVGTVWLRDHSVHFIINSHPLNNEDTFSAHDSANLPHSVLAQQTLNASPIMSSGMPPIYAMQEGLLQAAHMQNPIDSNKYK